MEVLEIFNGLLAPAGMADPYPLYAALHEHGPIVRANEQLVLVPGYELASSVLRDSAFRVPDAELLDEVNPGWREHPSLDPNSMHRGTTSADLGLWAFRYRLDPACAVGTSAQLGRGMRGSIR